MSDLTTYGKNQEEKDVEPDGGQRGDDVLAIVVPHYGQPTETFIRRYCEELLPSRTVLVHFYDGCGSWRINAPTFSLPKAAFGSVLMWKGFRGVQKLLIGQGLFSDSYTSGKLEKFLRQHRVTAVFSQYLIAGWNVHSVVKRMGLRHVIRGHGFDVSTCLDSEIWRSRFMELVNADAIVVPSPFQVQRLHDSGLQGANVLSVPYGVNFPDCKTQTTVLKEANRPVVRVVAVGRMVAKKAPLAMLQSFLRAAKRVPELRLSYIGSGELEGMVREFVSANDPNGLIEVLGSKNHGDVLRILGSADIFVQHSVTDPATGDQEGAPVAILEAMAHGLPVVSTNHSGIPYLVEHRESGLLTPEGDVEQMAESLVMLARSPGLRLEMGRRGQDRARSLTWERERDTLLELLFPGRA